MYFNVNFNVFFKLIKVHLLVSELYMLHGINLFKLADLRANLSYHMIMKICYLVGFYF